MMLEGHSNELVLLLAGCTLLVGLHGYWHARHYWEGLPPILDAFVSMTGFVAIIIVFVWAGRIGGYYGHPHAARVLAVAVTLIILRAVRTWIGKEQVRYRKARARFCRRGMNIRRATPTDFPVICDLHQRAFSASQLGYHGEAELVDARQADGDAVCRLVAERDGRKVGHIMFSRMAVLADGQPLRAASLAPVSVLPEAQRLGVGTALTKAGLDQLITEGFQISFVLGNAEYYCHFGYSLELAAAYQSPFSGPHFMAVHLDSELRVTQKGKAEYAPAFLAMG